MLRRLGLVLPLMPSRRLLTRRLVSRAQGSTPPHRLQALPQVLCPMLPVLPRKLQLRPRALSPVSLGRPRVLSLTPQARLLMRSRQSLAKPRMRSEAALLPPRPPLAQLPVPSGPLHDPPLTLLPRQLVPQLGLWAPPLRRRARRLPVLRRQLPTRRLQWLGKPRLRCAAVLRLP